MQSDSFNRKLKRALCQVCGFTDEPSKAAWIMLDGRMLNQESFDEHPHLDSAGAAALSLRLDVGGYEACDMVTNCGVIKVDRVGANFLFGDSPNSIFGVRELNIALCDREPTAAQYKSLEAIIDDWLSVEGRYVYFSFGFAAKSLIAFPIDGDIPSYFQEPSRYHVVKSLSTSGMLEEVRRFYANNQ
jgi:hypothetical protein